MVRGGLQISLDVGCSVVAHSSSALVFCIMALRSPQMSVRVQPDYMLEQASSSESDFDSESARGLSATGQNSTAQPRRRFSVQARVKDGAYQVHEDEMS